MAKTAYADLERLYQFLAEVNINAAAKTLQMLAVAPRTSPYHPLVKSCHNMHREMSAVFSLVTTRCDMNWLHKTF